MKDLDAGGGGGGRVGGGAGGGGGGKEGCKEGCKGGGWEVGGHRAIGVQGLGNMYYIKTWRGGQMSAYRGHRAIMDTFKRPTRWIETAMSPITLGILDSCSL